MNVTSDNSDVVALRQIAELAISLLGRIAFPPEILISIIGGGSSAGKLRAAYNMCDGTHTQKDIVKELGFDPGNFSRTVKRWETLGILAKINAGNEIKLLGLYRIDV
jgi:hypothetical protein